MKNICCAFAMLLLCVGQALAVPNFYMVSPTLWRGGQPEVGELAKLKAAGAKTIIDLRNEEVLVRKEEAEARSCGLKFVNIPMDVFNPPSQDAVRKFLQVVNDEAAQPVYVHCLHGQDRTGTMIAIYRIHHDGWDTDKAYKEMVQRGFRQGLSRLTDAVYAEGARAGRPGTKPRTDAIIQDLQGRLQRKP